MKFPQFTSAKKHRKRTIKKIIKHIEEKIKGTKNEQIRNELNDLIKEIPNIFKKRKSEG